MIMEVERIQDSGIRDQGRTQIGAPRFNQDIAIRKSLFVSAQVVFQATLFARWFNVLGAILRVVISLTSNGAAAALPPGQA